MLGKISTATSVAERKEQTPDLKIVGRQWQTLSRASSVDEGWSRHTKVLRFASNGFLVQVSTRQKNLDGSWSVGEALTYVPYSEMPEAEAYDPLRLLLTRLAREGGEIVSSAACTMAEIALARSEGRLYINDDSLGYVYFPPKQTVGPVTFSDEEIAAAQAAQLGSEPVFQADGTVTTTAVDESASTVTTTAVDESASTDATDADKSANAGAFNDAGEFQRIVKKNQQKPIASKKAGQ